MFIEVTRPLESGEESSKLYMNYFALAYLPPDTLRGNALAGFMWRLFCLSIQGFLSACS